MQNKEERHYQQQMPIPLAPAQQAQDMHSVCRNHMNRYILAQTNDGRSYDGIIEHVDQDYVYMAVPNADMYTSPDPQIPIATHMTAGRRNSSTSKGVDFNEREERGTELGESEVLSDERSSDQRQIYGAGFGYGYPGYGPWYGGYGGYGGYGAYGGYPVYGFGGYGFPRRRRFQRLILPLAALTAISLLPYY